MHVIYRDVLRMLQYPIFQFLLAFVIGTATIAAAFWHSYRKHGYWRKRGVPYIKPVPVFGSVLATFTKPLHISDQEGYKTHGRICGFYEGNQPVLMVADPDLLRHILVKDFQSFTNRRHIQSGIDTFDSILSNLQGEDWKRVRTIITPTFTTGKIKRMFNIFRDCADSLIRNFRGPAERGETVEVKRMYGAFTMDVIASSAFSTKIDSHNDPSNEFVANAKRVFSTDKKWLLIFFFLFPSFFKLFKISLFPAKAMTFFQTVTLQMIEERKKTGETRNDFLQLLMDTAKEVAEEGKLDATENEKDDITANYGKENNTHIFKGTYAKKSLSQSELIAQCIIFFIAGYETTASTLAFATYALALNQGVQEKLLAELDEVLKETGGELTYEAIQGMKYLDNVISETLRIFPPAVRVERVANEDYRLGDTGITIPKGMVVSVPVFSMHRDPDNYPNPETFDPDRFSQAERAKRNPYVYIPFGAGPRNCVAMRFALMEVKVCLAHVLTQFTIKRSPETKEPLDFYLGQGLLQPKEIKVRMELRKR